MELRTLFLFIFLAVLCWFRPVVVYAELPMVAIVLPKGIERYAIAHSGFEERWGQCPKASQTDLYVQRPSPEKLSLANSIRKAVGFDAKIIGVYGDRAALAVVREIPNVPVVFGEVYAPAEIGLPSPGESSERFTGISNFTPVRTMLRNFRGVSPSKQLGVIYDPDDLAGRWQYRQIVDMLPNLGMEGQEILMGIEDAPGKELFQQGDRFDAVFVTDSYALTSNLQKMVDLADQSDVPVISQIPNLADSGALIDMAADPREQGEALADMVCKLLSGESSGNIPVLSPSRVELVINLRQAKRFGFRIPFQVLGMATRIIQDQEVPPQTGTLKMK